MNDNEKILSLAREAILKIEGAFQDEKNLLDKEQRMDVKLLKEYANTMKTLAEIIREAKNEQLMIQPIEVILGGAEEYAD